MIVMISGSQLKCCEMSDRIVLGLKGTLSLIELTSDSVGIPLKVLLHPTLVVIYTSKGLIQGSVEI